MKAITTHKITLGPLVWDTGEQRFVPPNGHDQETVITEMLAQEFALANASADNVHGWEIAIVSRTGIVESTDEEADLLAGALDIDLL